MSEIRGFRDGTVDGDLDDRYYTPVHTARDHASFEEMLNCNQCWLEEAAARREALDGVLDSTVGNPVSGPAEQP
jgi:hypothetical protein